MERLKSNEGILQDKTILEKIVRQIHGSAEMDGVQSFRSGALNLNIELKIRNPATTFNLRVFFGQDAETRARRENTAYALISRNTEIPTPQVLIADYSKSMIGSVFSLQTRIPGISLDDIYKDYKLNIIHLDKSLLEITVNKNTLINSPIIRIPEQGLLYSDNDSKKRGDLYVYFNIILSDEEHIVTPDETYESIKINDFLNTHRSECY